MRNTDFWGGLHDANRVSASFRVSASLLASFLCLSLGLGAQVSILTISGAQAGDVFGATVVTVGDTDGDGVTDLAVSATSGGAAGYGYVQVLSGVDFSLRLTIDPPVLPVYFNQAFGTQVAEAGDLNGDGFDDLLIGRRLGTPPSVGGPGNSFVEAYSGIDGSFIRNMRGASACYSVAPRIEESFDALGDINGDGITDVLTGQQGGIASGCPIFGGCTVTCPGDVQIISGATGGVALDLQQGAGYRLAALENIGDANGDGRDDFIAASLGNPAQPDLCSSFCFGIAMRPLRIRTHASSSGLILHEITGIYASSIRVDAVGDFTGDGVSEALISVTGGASVTALVPGLGTAPLFTEVGSPPHTAATRIGDQNGDGVEDVLVGKGSQNRVEIRSGVDFSLITSINGLPTFGRSLCRLGDLNLDGTEDFAVGVPSFNFVEVFLGGAVTTAAAMPVGGGSGDGMMPPPVLTVGRPVLGSTLSFAVSQAVPSGIGTLLASPGPAVTPFPGSPWVVDWNTAVFPLAPITTDSTGNWGLNLPLPTLFAAEGARFTVQAVVWAPTVGTASNGFELTLGF